MTTLPYRQRSPEWLAARRDLITATDIPVLLGVSPWKCEADLADEKRGTAEPSEPSLRMRVGSFLEPLIADEYARATGAKVRRSHVMVRHPDLPWAAASLDATVVGERRVLELKRASRQRFANGVPEDIEAQVAWQLGCTGYPDAHIAVLHDDDLAVYEQAADPDLFAELVRLAESFRRRLAEGGPFARDLARLRRDHPTDDGTEMAADADLEEAVRALLGTRERRKVLEDNEARLEAAIKDRMGDHAVLTGAGWRVTWKRTKDREETDWRSLATGLLTALPETERATLVGLHTAVRDGFRPFRVVLSKEE
jgi:putative phage-type endonuclease